MGVVLKTSCSRVFPLLFSASSVVTPKSHGERGLEVICTVVGEAGWKLQLSRWGMRGQIFVFWGKTSEELTRAAANWST